MLNDFGSEFELKSEGHMVKYDLCGKEKAAFILWVENSYFYNYKNTSMLTLQTLGFSLSY